MPANNLSWFFNVEYYDGAFDSQSDMSTKNDVLKKARPQNEVVGNIPEQSAFQLQVEYPGLMAGVGYPHAAGVKGEICAGCSLDYVTGLPYLPGSSIKGVLRSAFRHEGYIEEILKEILGIEEIDVKALEAEIFENSDVFLDAFPVDGMCNGVMELENITPHHSSALGTLAEPTPLTFAKVKPGVIYEFRFVLNDSEKISAENKLGLFKQIILDLGAGAKTNVGFGRFTDDIVPVEPVAVTHAPQNEKSQFRKHTAGKCRKCGRETKINQKTGEPYPLCFKCSQERNGR